ncbi:hypothetical protein, partial [Bacillus amyloliquefaciens]|uniref:hypothetical protein n=1 Tax=Bacillus amyloliquefaciens TaxID=1390 RepID=UPI0037D9187A
MDLSTNFDRLDFVHNRKKFYTLSVAIMIVGIIIISIFKLNLGIDFSSGTRVEILTEEQTTQEEMN